MPKEDDTSTPKVKKLEAKHIEELKKYTACDISDALLRLNVHGAGFIPDLHPYTAPSAGSKIASSLSGLAISGGSNITVGRASTILFIPKGGAVADSEGRYGATNIKPEEHWVDLAPEDTFVVCSQPPHQNNAIIGGLMAFRMKALNVVGAIVYGRVRDIDELQESGLPIFAKGTSTVGSGMASKAWIWDSEKGVAMGESGVVVHAGDVVFADDKNGVVVIPIGKLGEVLELLPETAKSEAALMEAVKGGAKVADAQKKHRGA